MATQRARRATHRLIVRSAVRMVIGLAVLFGVYFSAPLGQRPVGSVLATLVLSLLLLAGVVTWQILAVTRSASPVLRAVEGIAVSVPLLLLVFAATYFATGQAQPGSFSEPLTRFDALYFSVTVFASVGFGDIAAASQVSRVLVTIQMVADLVLIGLIAKVLVGAAQGRRSALDAGSDPAAGSSGSGG